MTKLLHYKQQLAELAAKYYLCDPYNSLGKDKGKPRKYPSFFFGPNNLETAALIKALNRNRRKTFWQKIVDAAEKEQQKVMLPQILYTVEPPREGEFCEKIELTEKQYRAIFDDENAN